MRNAGFPFGSALLVALARPGTAQSFVVDSSVLPTTPSARSEEVEIIDVDIDGDLDVFLAKGGEMTGVTEALWINQGGLQAGILGLFVDESSARLPLFADPSTDVDLIDIDGDGDLDSHLTNTDFLGFSVTSRWSVNVGGVQGGTLGYFVDETAQRWVGLAGPGSTLTASDLVFRGGWSDSSHRSAFADLDNDGDLDLVHSTYTGDTPIRVFLSDGLGFFAEHNPVGTTLPFGSLLDGSTAIWCEGIQQEDTTDSSGAFCDIVLRSTDLDLADIDGDLDVDIVPSDWTGYQQRLFANRLEGSALAPATNGPLIFRDTTSLSLPLVVAAVAPVCAELGDLDLDGDMDLYGGNWEAASGLSHEDALFQNVGAGVFATGLLVSSSTPQDIDVAFLDFDGDEDLDICVGVVSGNRLYRNDGAFQLTLEPNVGLLGDKSDVGVGDTDGDGDTDMLLTRAFGKEEFQRNITQVPDQSAPWFPVLESLADRVAEAGAFPVRAHVLDNDSWMRTRFARTRVELAVGGIALSESPARWAGAQVFRAELPANLFGAVSWRFVATDEHENTGASPWQGYTASFAGTFQVPYGSPTAGLAGGPPALSALSVPMSGSTFHLALANAASPGTPSIIAIGTQALDPGLLLPGLLYLQVFGTQLLAAPGSLGASGAQVLALPLGALPAGLSVFAQGFVFDPTADGQLLASSQGLQIITQ
jgi:hypothetical protein